MAGSVSLAADAWRGRTRGTALGVLACTLGIACSGRHDSSSGRRADASPPPSAHVSADASPDRAAVTALQRELQSARLALPPRRRHLPGLAFGSGALGRLRDDSLQVLDDRTLEELARIPLEQPRAVLGMADGALVAVGTSGLVRWERGKPVAPPAPRPVLLPGAELYPDPRRADVIWVLDPDAVPPKLTSYALGATSVSRVLVPEQTIEAAGPRGGTFGVTREGVWLYVTPGKVERFAPSGLKLPSLRSTEGTAPSWTLPSRRIDQSLWLEDTGPLTRVLVSPVFKSLSRVSSGGAPYTADVGDEGRLLGLVVVTGAGPRFELALFDTEHRERGRVVLPGDSPTGRSDWVPFVTRNQQLAVAPREARVAVGGPDRLTIFDGAGNIILSK